MRLLTSRMSGMLRMTTSSLVNSEAQTTCRASFLAPWGTMVPLSRWPPSILNDAIGRILLLLAAAFLSFVDGKSRHILKPKRAEVDLDDAVGQTGNVVGHLLVVG